MVLIFIGRFAETVIRHNIGLITPITDQDRCYVDPCFNGWLKENQDSFCLFLKNPSTQVLDLGTRFQPSLPTVFFLDYPKAGRAYFCIIYLTGYHLFAFVVFMFIILAKVLDWGLFS